MRKNQTHTSLLKLKRREVETGSTDNRHDVFRYHVVVVLFGQIEVVVEKLVFEKVCLLVLLHIQVDVFFDV